MRWQILPVVSLALFVAVGCDQQPVGPAAEQVADVPSFKIGDGPPASGIVIRGEFNNAYGWTDFKTGLQVIVGADMDEFCAGIYNFDVVAFMDVNIEGRPILGPAYGEDMQTTVWGFTDFDCALFTTVEPLASGYSDLINTDNDLFGTAPDDNNANAWGIRAHGILTRPNGDAARFSGHINMRYNHSSGYRETAVVQLH